MHVNVLFAFTCVGLRVLTAGRLAYIHIYAYTTLPRVVMKSLRFLEIKNTSSLELSKIQEHKNFLSLILPEI